MLMYIEQRFEHVFLKNAIMSPAVACFNRNELLSHILSFTDNPAVSSISWGFYHAQNEFLRQKYNRSKESHRFRFYVDTDGNNEAVTAQQNEVDYFLIYESDILSITNRSIEVISCFEKLKGYKEFIRFEVLTNKKIPYPKIKIFLEREKILDELNVAIISSKMDYIHSVLTCEGCHLTRFPGKIITQHRNYFKSLQRLYLINNNLQNLPPEIGQLRALEIFFLDNNWVQSLPPEIGQLMALERLILYNNKLKSLPPEIGQLTVLTDLNLLFNPIQSLHPEIRQLENLKYLSLDNDRPFPKFSC